MRLLYICNKSPYPPNEGGSLGMYVFIKGMMEAGQGAGLIKEILSVNELFDNLIEEFDSAVTKLSGIK